MKVKHLIRELQKCDPELEVATEGCDCYGDTFAVVIREPERGRRDFRDVVICRSNEVAGPVYDNTADTPNPIER